MSSEGSDSDIGQSDVEAVATMAYEPSYISEIARKMQLAFDDWAELSHNAAVVRVSKIVNALSQNRNVDVEEIGANEGLQMEGSPHKSAVPAEVREGNEWLDYKIVWNKSGNIDEGVEEALEYTDPNVTVRDKVDMVAALSNLGNVVSRLAEEIMQDVFERQFRYYDKIEVPEYNDPGVDFYVEDEGNREWGLCIEVSVRYVNPIDKPYVESKKEKAIDKDADLVILAPKFTDGMLRKHENEDDPAWHSDPEGRIVHLHRVPPKDYDFYRPFTFDVGEFKENETTRGNPIIVPDKEAVRSIVSDTGLVGDRYPVVDSSFDEFRNLLETVNREYTVIPESRFRNFIREAVEPLLWEFLRPYKIEQFLIDTYWDKELTQSDIGQLVDRSGSTMGDWMQRWGVMRRGTGAPELSAETVEIWRRMYEGESPFPEQFSGYRIQAEYNRHPLWSLSDWREWYNNTTEAERQELVQRQGSYRNNIDYTVMSGATERLLPSYTFILRTLKDEGVDVRNPDEAPRVPYSAYPSKDALRYMINKNENTIVEVDES
jgi:hypothetical protein